jgi:hypothetical protein
MICSFDPDSKPTVESDVQEWKDESPRIATDEGI